MHVHCPNAYLNIAAILLLLRLLLRRRKHPELSLRKVDDSSSEALGATAAEYFENLLGDRFTQSNATLKHLRISRACFEQPFS
jgi:hypothetical protein